ncbi:MAG: Na/Pi cotransporter family protein, partial [Magnetococcales bacterium]|nr:Na/Pi cotransporter family protein [Magnetococcales bacterium]
QIANAHTIFNVVMALVFLPFGTLFARFCEAVVPDKTEAELAAEGAVSGAYKPKYLDDNLLTTPALAIGMVRREMNIMADTLEQMINDVPDAVFKGDLKKMEEIRQLDDRVDEIHDAIAHYLSQVGSQNIPAHTADEVMAAITATSEMESIGDIIENNLSHLAEVCASGNIKLSDEVIGALGEYHQAVKKAFQTSVTAFVSDNRQAAEMVMNMKDEISSMDAQSRAKQMQALQSGEAVDSLNTYTLQMDIRENLKRIYYHTKRISKLVARTEDAAAWKAVS